MDEYKTLLKVNEIPFEDRYLWCISPATGLDNYGVS
jgi:hypothetical protein